MAIRLQHNQLGVKDVSRNVNIPTNDVARLMYYLNCVCFTIDYNDNDIGRFCQYNNWSQLANEDIRVVIIPIDSSRSIKSVHSY